MNFNENTIFLVCFLLSYLDDEYINVSITVILGLQGQTPVADLFDVSSFCVISHHRTAELLNIYRTLELRIHFVHYYYMQNINKYNTSL